MNRLRLLLILAVCGFALQFAASLEQRSLFLGLASLTEICALYVAWSFIEKLVLAALSSDDSEQQQS